MELTHISRTVLEKRYLRLKEDGTRETPDDMLRRVAGVIAEMDRQYGATEDEVKATEAAFFSLMDNQEFMPNSPTFTGAGTSLGQLSACFVLPVGDSLGDIYETMKHAALIHQTGGGTGFAFSRLRPAGDKVRSSQGVASGPVSFLKVYNASTEAIKQGGTRRGANMGILKIDHPDILEFIASKSDTSQITNFNISVGITDRFMAALEEDGEYDLINPRDHQPVKQLRAREVWEKLVDCAWQTGEPGVVFIDRMNRRNPNNHAEVIEATNPCGEQPLPPYGSCNLGSINLANFVSQPYTADADVDWERLGYVVRTATHFLDNVIDANKYPLPQIGEKARRDRRIGLGVMGWAEMLVQMGYAYDSEEAVNLAAEVMTFVKLKATEESAALAEVRSAYPEWEGSQWHRAGVKVRNATMTTVAPTGTISLFGARPSLPCSGGIEPKFALVFTRNQADAIMLDVDGQFEQIARREGWYSEELMKEIAEHGTARGVAGVPDRWQRVFATSHDIKPEWHVRMQAAFQGGDELPITHQPVDAAVSKTINFPHDATREDVEHAYSLAWNLGLKGITVYRDGSRAFQVLTSGNKTEEKKEGAAEEQRPAVAAAPAPKGPSVAPRPTEAIGKMFVIPTHFGKMTMDVHMDDAGEAFEVIVNVGAAGSDLMADAVGMGMLVSKMLRLRSDVPVRERIEIIVDTLKNIGGSGSYGFGPNRVTSLASAISKGLQRFLAWKDSAAAGNVIPMAIAAGAAPPHEAHHDAHAPMMAGAELDKHVDPCPECGSHSLAVGEGCCTCHNCGYSKCS
ncbi:MAG TPA: vitamin B12-dependent ribonucleotide reductase [Symbiobacteriaceae bacterium]|nr:vitamin B12-dependent ribonucleotide reductase [Symbiobacteriaceae bacterium]